MSYVYEAFFSYRRHPQSDGWHEALKERIAYYTGLELGIGNANIFFDRTEIKTGDDWIETIEDSLLRSKCVVSILSPNYFQSKYCVSELKTFIERSKQSRRKLVVSAKNHDGENFPPIFPKSIQIEDFVEFHITASRFWDTEKAVYFDEKIKKFSVDLAGKIKLAPVYDPNFIVSFAGDDELVNTVKIIARPANEE